MDNKYRIKQDDLCGRLDFSKYEFVDLYGADLSKVTYLKGAKKTDMAFAKGLNGCLDFRETDDLNMYWTDCKDVKQLYVNSSASCINISKIENLYCSLNLGSVKRILANNADFSGADVVFNSNADILDLFGAVGLKGDLYFHKVKQLDLGYSDLSKVNNIKFNPYAIMINLAGTRGLKGTLDFGYAKLVGLRNADLSKVYKIVCGQNTTLNHLTDKHAIEVIRLPMTNIQTQVVSQQLVKSK